MKLAIYQQMYSNSSKKPYIYRYIRIVLKRDIKRYINDINRIKGKTYSWLKSI